MAPQYRKIRELEVTQRPLKSTGHPEHQYLHIDRHTCVRVITTVSSTTTVVHVNDHDVLV